MNLFNRYCRAYQYLAIPVMVRDGLGALRTSLTEFLLFWVSVCWVVFSPVLAVIEVARPGGIDRFLFKLGR